MRTLFPSSNPAWVSDQMSYSCRGAAPIQLLRFPALWVSFSGHNINLPTAEDVSFPRSKHFLNRPGPWPYHHEMSLIGWHCFSLRVNPRLPVFLLFFSTQVIWYFPSLLLTRQIRQNARVWTCASPWIFQTKPAVSGEGLRAQARKVEMNKQLTDYMSRHFHQQAPISFGLCL